jgi:hypothetical protein
MVKRVIVGNNNNQIGMWVSRATKDAATSTNDEDFLINNNRLNSIPVLKGIINNPTVYYQGSTKSVSFEPVCTAYREDLSNCQTYYYIGAVWRKTGTDFFGKDIYRWCTATYTCTNYQNQQVANTGVATYLATIPHGLGYIPQSILSTTTDYPGTPVPNIFIDENNIYLRYYEIDAGTVGSGIAFFANKPSAYTLSCTVIYTLYARAA